MFRMALRHLSLTLSAAMAVLTPSAIRLASRLHILTKYGSSFRPYYIQLKNAHEKSKGLDKEAFSTLLATMKHRSHWDNISCDFKLKHWAFEKLIFQLGLFISNPSYKQVVQKAMYT